MTSPTKSIKPIEVTQGHSHIKIALQDSLRVRHWEEEPWSIWLGRQAGPECRRTTGLREAETLGGHTPGFKCTGTQHKAIPP